jgi:hypothetical protein
VPVIPNIAFWRRDVCGKIKEVKIVYFMLVFLAIIGSSPEDNSKL